MKKLLVTLTVAESKRLIAKGLLATDIVQAALHHGYLCVTLGTTSAYLVEEILGEYDKSRHIAGLTIPHGLWVTDSKMRAYDAIFHKGEYMEKTKVKDVIDEMGPDDVIIKSANALDANLIPLVLLASGTGGTVGSFLGTAAARNIPIIMPAGLEKCIPSEYGDFVGEFGRDQWDYAIGEPVGVIAVPEGIPFTEMEALEALFDVYAIPISAGGINGAEGSVTFYVEGDDEQIDEAYKFLKDLKGEPIFPLVEHLKERE
ncbi:MAG: hypothetical protein BAJATHORv1_50092 [Candidatus Thorarchaeota archaeon]|nr:MAG: hypothetical protein BAJATHORv1_50092 [Candidatus Thorarchaeota archaeon]